MKKALKIIIIATLVVAILGVLILLALHVNGFSGLHNHTEAKDGQIKVACVGDSITYGHGISNWDKNNYPAQLQEILGDKYHVQNFGHSGKTLSSHGDQPYIESEQYKLSLEYKPDILVLMLGTNDSKPQNWFDDIEIISALDSLIRSYIEVNPDVKILICTPAAAFYMDSESSITNFNIRPAVVETISYTIMSYAVNNVLSIPQLYNIVNVYENTIEHPEWFSDYVHPNIEGARAIAELVAQKITAIK